MSDATAGAVSDPLADLNLDLGTETQSDAPAKEKAARAPREEVNIGELAFEEVDFIPVSKRGGASGSKYEFEKLGAPVPKDEADLSKGFRYSTFTANLQEGVDIDKLKRSVQSATTAENRAEKAAGSKIRYITRSKVVAGEAVGITVFRVDDTLNDEAES